jgi:small-conductance mechanosensitive channel
MKGPQHSSAPAEAAALPDELGAPPAGSVALLDALWRDFRAHLPEVIGAIFILACTVFAARGIRGLVRHALRRHDPTFARMLAQLAEMGAIVLGVLIAFWIAFPTINFREIFAGLGVTGLILGFALKDIIENFVAGLLILWRRPFRVGDQIRSGNYEGTVQEINFRSTILKTFDGIQVFVPNGKVFTEPLENLTGYRARRLELVLGIDQNASIARAREVILGELGRIDGVLTDPPPLVLFEHVDDSTNNLHVLLWTEPPTRLSERLTRSDVTERLYTALTADGIGFPYPIRTIRLEHDRRLSGGDHV